MVCLSAQLRTVVLAGSMAFCAHQALAADFKLPIERAPAAISQPVELGSGWYLRGGVGGSAENGPRLSSLAADPKKNLWNIDLGAGYKFNNWLRTDATISWSKQRDIAANGFTVICPAYISTNVTLANSALWDPSVGTCNPQNSASLRKTDLMLNAYVDLGSWAGLTPFVGVGAGVSMLKSASSLAYYPTSDGGAYAANLTQTRNYIPVWVDSKGNPITSWTDGAGAVHQGQPPVSLTQQNWNRNASKTAFNLAWSLMGGVAYDIDSQLKLELSYRYLNAGAYTSLATSPLNPVKSNIESHQVKLGFRYMID